MLKTTSKRLLVASTLALLGAVSVSTQATAETGSAGELALIPRADGLMINVTKVSKAIVTRDVPVTCQLTVIVGKARYKTETKLASALEFTDIGGGCLVAHDAFKGLAWPLAEGSLRVEGQIVINGKTARLTPTTLTLKDGALPSRNKLMKAVAAVGYKVSPGEGSQDFGTVHYEEWLLTGHNEEVLLTLHWGTSDHLPKVSGCDVTRVDFEHPCVVRSPFVVVSAASTRTPAAAKALRDAIEATLNPPSAKAPPPK